MVQLCQKCLAGNGKTKNTEVSPPTRMVVSAHLQYMLQFWLVGSRTSEEMGLLLDASTIAKAQNLPFPCHYTGLPGGGVVPRLDLIQRSGLKVWLPTSKNKIVSGSYNSKRIKLIKEFLTGLPGLFCFSVNSRCSQIETKNSHLNRKSVTTYSYNIMNNITKSFTSHQKGCSPDLGHLGT